MRINKNLAIDIRADFCTRMRALGKKPAEIAQLNRFLETSLANVNELEKGS